MCAGGAAFNDRTRSRTSVSFVILSIELTATSSLRGSGFGSFHCSRQTSLTRVCNWRGHSSPRITVTRDVARCQFRSGSKTASSIPRVRGARLRLRRSRAANWWTRWTPLSNPWLWRCLARIFQTTKSGPAHEKRIQRRAHHRDWRFSVYEWLTHSNSVNCHFGKQLISTCTSGLDYARQLRIRTRIRTRIKTRIRKVLTKLCLTADPSDMCDSSASEATTWRLRFGSTGTGNMALLATLEANLRVWLDFIAIRIIFRYTRGHCVTCFPVLLGVARSGLITQTRVLLYGQRTQLFLGIVISAGLPSAWRVRVLFRPITRIARWAVLTAVVLSIPPPDIELARCNVTAAYEYTGSERRTASLACAMRTASFLSSKRCDRSRIK